MIRLISKTPKTTWDIGESWDRVNLQVTTHAGTFTSASPLQIAIPKALSELKKQVEYYKKNAGAVSMPRGFIEQAQALKKEFYGKLIASGIFPVVLRPLDRRTPSANHYALCKGTVWMSASPLSPEEWVASVDRAMQDPEGVAFETIIGQDHVKSAVRERIQRARKLGAALPHLLIHGAAETGKRTIAQVIAQAFDVGFDAVSADDLSDGNALTGVLSNIQAL